MAGAGSLDVAAMADLAEARWRSGDLEGAAEAAMAHQASGGQEPLAALIIAEDLARRGRTQDALRPAEWVYQRVGGAVDQLFAGEPRSEGIWPPVDEGWMDAGATTPGRWGLLVGGREVAGPTPGTWARAPLTAPAPEVPSGAPQPSASGPLSRPAQGLAAGTSAAVVSGRIAGEELARAEQSLAAGHPRAAAERLAVLLRLDPALAPVILSSADRAAARASGDALAAIHLVRGDAYRLLGRENEAASAYRLAHHSLGQGPTSEEST